jgi:hypothetical protein
MTENNYILFTPNSIQWLEAKFQSLEEKIANHRSQQVEIQDEWIPLKKFMALIDVKSHYSVSKLEQAARIKGIEFKSTFRGRQRFIHFSEVKNYRDGLFELKKG